MKLLDQAKSYNKYLKEKSKKLGLKFHYVSEGEAMNMAEISENIVKITKAEIQKEFTFIERTLRTRRKIL